MKTGASLQRQLFIWLLLPQLVLWAAGALFTYKLAERYATEAVDASLLQATRALARQIKPMGTGLLIDLPRAAQDVLEADPDDKLLYTVSSPPGQFILGNRDLPAPPLGGDSSDQPLVYDGVLPASAGQPELALRVASLTLNMGEQGDSRMRVQVARSSANREELARRLLVDTMLPLSVLVLLLSLIVWAGIRAGLAPIQRLRRAVEGRAPNDLRPIEIDTAPTELRSLAIAINQLLGAVQRTVQGQRRFIADAAHQLRTPLAGLKGQAELALADASDPAQRERLQRVVEAATRSAHLVVQLLALARAEPEAVGAQQGFERLDLSRLARELTAEWVPKALATDIDLGLDEHSSPSCWVHGHPTLLREALANLLDNALRYAGRGAEVTVCVQQQGDRAELTVSDNGPGLPQHLQLQVLERFVRATHEGSGCGLGLAIVKEIAERHGGSVRLADHPPQGLQALIELPAINQQKLMFR